MELNRVLVVYKQISQSAQKKLGRSTGVQTHLRTLDALYQLLKDFDISFETRSTQQLGRIGNVDMVITVGGDGTVLTASHYVNTQPILGIKSFGEQSVGFFCAATRETMGLYLRSVLEKRYRPTKLGRLKVTVDKHVIKELVLNDLLFANAFPASMSKYSLTIGKKSEYQTSSGIWVSTAAGSTAAIHAAGGKVMPILSRKMQYLVREPYTASGQYKLIKGMLKETETLKLQSSMKNGTLYIDGHYIQYPAPDGANIRIETSDSPLLIMWR